MKFFSKVSLYTAGNPANFFTKRGMKVPSGTFYNHHVKVLSGEIEEEISANISQIMNREVEAFMVVNTGNVFVYEKALNAIYLYFPDTATAELMELMDEDNLNWFVNVYLDSDAVHEVIFNSGLFGIELAKNEILSLPIEATNEEPESYKRVDMRAYFDLHRQEMIGK